MERLALQLLCAVIFILTGCSDHTIAKIDIKEPKLLVHPERLEFGNLVSGEETSKQSFSIINVGDATLYVVSPIFVDGSPNFILSDPGEIELAPGTLVDVFVEYEPKTYEENDGLIQISSNAVNTANVDVVLTGNGDAPVMSVEPQIYDFGDLTLGCLREETITIRNDGNLDLEISDINQLVTQPQDLDVTYGSLSDFPWLVKPGQELDIYVEYEPADLGFDEQILTIENNDPLKKLFDVNQEGEGLEQIQVTDTWIQEEISSLDILWVIDNSCSMYPYQAELANQMDSFVSSLMLLGPTFNMSFITTDQPDLIDNAIVTEYSLDPTFEVQMILSNIGTGGSAFEKGIENAYLALNDPNSAAPGSLFYREYSQLVIIYLSDEPDQSGDISLFTPFFDSLKTAGLVSMYGVIGDYPVGCDAAQFGSGYYEIIHHYSGDWYSICALDWGVQLKDLALNLATKRKFELSSTDVDIASIQIYVNGQTQQTGWYYDPAINSIIFEEGSIPTVGQTINIDYKLVGC